MATVQSLMGGRFAQPTRPLFDRRDYGMAVVVGSILACVAALRLGVGPLEHAALDPVANRGFLFGLLEYTASHVGNLPTVALVGILVCLVSLQVAALSKHSEG